MKKIKNKFIIFIILGIAGIVGGTLLKPFVFSDAPESVIILLQGEGFLNEAALQIDTPEVIHVGDIIETRGKESLGVIEWGDGSVTRLGGDSKLEITENFISSDQSNIQIAFHLFTGKTWSNVISFLGEESYFKQSFRDSEAGVRGTIFNVDLEEDYLYVTDHQVELKKSDGETIIVTENNPISLLNFSFIDLQKFINDIKDKAWEELNMKFDKEYIEGLKKDLIKKLEKNNPLVKFQEIYNQTHADSLSLEERAQVYKKLLTEYQNFNFLGGDDTDLFQAKQKLRDTMLLYADDRQKESLLQSTLVDFKDLLDEKNFPLIDSLLPSLEQNKELLKNISKEFLAKQDIIPESLQNIMSDNLKQLFGIFNSSIPFQQTGDFSSENITESLDSLKQGAKDLIHGGLDSLFQKK